MTSRNLISPSVPFGDISDRWQNYEPLAISEPLVARVARLYLTFQGTTNTKTYNPKK